MAKAEFKFSTNFEAVRSRLRRLPKLVNSAMDSSTKKDVVSVIEAYQNGIRKNNFRLHPLTIFTINRKKAKGLTKPKTPLYGEGDSEKNSLINALAFRKLKNGYRLYRRKAKHYEADLTLEELLLIHEHGAIIKNGFGRGVVIRIPPRPVVDLAMNRALRKKKKGEPDKTIWKAINQLIRTGQTTIFDKMTNYAERMADIET